MSTAKRMPILAANWKMNLRRRDAEGFCRTLLAELGEPGIEVVLFPPFTLLDTVSRQLVVGPVACGGQDIHPQAAGAHTGDISGPQLVDVGCAWTLCGHSERRRDHGESDELIAHKARAARDHGLLPMICLGESRDERRSGRTFEVLERQLRAALSLEPSAFELAYEPVWAIGTGDTATPQLAQEVHAFLRQELGRLIGEERALATRILYGGSAAPDNVAGLIAEADIDGFLVGGASLDVKKFLAMIHICRTVG